MTVEGLINIYLVFLLVEIILLLLKLLESSLSCFQLARFVIKLRCKLQEWFSLGSNMRASTIEKKCIPIKYNRASLNEEGTHSWPREYT